MRVIILIVAFFAIACNDNKKHVVAAISNEPQKTDSTITQLKQEYPAGKTCSSDLGILRMNNDGETVGKRTELTELRKFLDKDCDIIEISYVLKGTGGEGNIGKKIIYNKKEKRLQDIYTENNVIEDYTDVAPEGLKIFLKKGEKSFYSLSNYTGAKYDFNNREMKQHTVGPPPSQNELDGSVAIVEKYIKAKANDASSIKFIEWSKVSPYGNYWIVRCMFKGTNSFGGIVTENKWFYIQNDEVLKMTDVNQ